MNNSIRWRIADFSSLTSEELYRCLRARQEVFVVEQQCAYLDADGKDAQARHLWGVGENGLLAAYCRILPPEVSYAEPSIGRVLTTSSFRGKALGRELMRRALDEIERLYPGQQVRISAQAYLLRFYESLGFRVCSEQYLEDNIVHQQMLWSPRGRG